MMQGLRNFMEFITDNAENFILFLQHFGNFAVKNKTLQQKMQSRPHILQNVIRWECKIVICRKCRICHFFSNADFMNFGDVTTQTQNLAFEISQNSAFCDRNLQKNGQIGGYCRIFCGNSVVHRK